MNAGGHLEEMMDLDGVSGFFDTVLCLYGHFPEGGQVVGNVVLQREHALFPQLHGSRAGEKLGAGINVVFFVSLHGDPVFRVGIAGRVAKNALTVLVNDQIKTGDTHLQKLLA